MVLCALRRRRRRSSRGRRARTLRATRSERQICIFKRYTLLSLEHTHARTHTIQNRREYTNPIKYTPPASRAQRDLCFRSECIGSQNVNFVPFLSLRRQVSITQRAKRRFGSVPPAQQVSSKTRYSRQYACGKYGPC